MEERRPFYTVSDIQRILKISRNSAYKLVRTAKFPSVKIGKSIRIDPDFFDLWVRSRV
jgi:excisionase family DNA binding protein